MAVGVGRLDIGEGIGNAQVFNPSPLIQQYGQILAQKQAKHDAEVKQLGDELARGYDPTGLRNDADKKAYIKQYNDLKEDAINIENEKDATKKAIGLSSIRQRLTDLGSFADGSKKQGVFERQLAMEHLKNPYLFDDDTAQKILSGKDKVWNDGDVIKDASQVVRGVDPLKADAAFDKDVASPILKNSQWQDFKGKNDVIAGKQGQWLYQRRGTPLMGDNGALEHAMAYASANNDFQKTLNDRYPQIVGNDKQSTLGLRVLKYMHDRGYANGFSEESKPEFKEGRNEQLTPGERLASYHWNLEHNPDGSPKYGTAATSNSPTYRQDIVKTALSGNLSKLSEIKQKVDADPSFDHSGKGLQIYKRSDGTIGIAIPDKKVYDSKANDGDGGWVTKTPGRIVHINPKEVGSDAKLNEVINEITGEKVDISALETPGGKKHVQGSGQTYQNITKAKDSNGNIVTLGLKNGKWFNTETNQQIQ